MLNIFTAGDRGLIIDEEGPATLVAIGSYVTCVSSSFVDKLADCAHFVLNRTSSHPIPGLLQPNWGSHPTIGYTWSE